MPEYTLYYWPIPFRGHFIRYVLAFAGATWDEAGFEATAEMKKLPVAEQPLPFMAPPLIHDRSESRWLSQMPAIVMYLAQKHGLKGDSNRALRLLNDACDILLEITRHHGERLWNHAAWKDFTETRLPRWMQIHEILVGEGPDIGLEDLVLAALWHTMIDRLPGMRDLLHDNAPELETRVDRVAAEPAIAAFLAEWKDSPARYCAGQIEASILDMLNKGPNHEHF